MAGWRQPNTGVQRHPRRSTTVPVVVATVDGEVDPATGARFYRTAEESTANLSRGGAYVRSWEPLAEGRRVLVTLALPDLPGGPRGGEIQLEGHVAWTQRRVRPNAQGRVEPAGYGVAFDGGRHADLVALGRYLDAIAPPEAPIGPQPSPQVASTPQPSIS